MGVRPCIGPLCPSPFSPQKWIKYILLTPPTLQNSHTKLLLLIFIQSPVNFSTQRDRKGSRQSRCWRFVTTANKRKNKQICIRNIFVTRFCCIEMVIPENSFIHSYCTRRHINIHKDRFLSIYTSIISAP